MFDHILVPLDGSPLAECVLPHAVAIARACGSRLTLMRALEQPHVVEHSQTRDPLGWHINEIEAQAYLDGLTARLRQAGLPVENTLQEGSAAERITEFVRDQDVDLVILGSHGQSGLSDWNVCSVAYKAVLRAHVPVMIVRAYQHAASDLISLRYRRILVGLDGSQRAECALPVATTLARFHESHLLLAHVVCRPEVPHRVPLARVEIKLVNQLLERGRLRAAKYLERLQSQLSADVQTRLLFSDSAAEELHELVVQENADLVLLSAHGYGGGTKWPFGSVALNFIAYGTTPLLVVQDLSPDELEETPAEMAARERKGH